MGGQKSGDELNDDESIRGSGTQSWCDKPGGESSSDSGAKKNAIQMSRLYYCRSRERDVGDGKDEKDLSDSRLPTHFC